MYNPLLERLSELNRQLTAANKRIDELSEQVAALQQVVASHGIEHVRALQDPVPATMQGDLQGCGFQSPEPPQTNEA